MREIVEVLRRVNFWLGLAALACVTANAFVLMRISGDNVTGWQYLLVLAFFVGLNSSGVIAAMSLSKRGHSTAMPMLTIYLVLSGLFDLLFAMRTPAEKGSEIMALGFAFPMMRPFPVLGILAVEFVTDSLVLMLARRR